MKKRLVSLLLVLVLAFTLVPSAFADHSDCGLAGCTCSGYCSYAYTTTARMTQIPTSTASTAPAAALAVA